jgi:UDP-N-acetylmuramyl pentapeptide phosphotransferase/UDP-N-acetylglucosamine-1-phosphate transferase
MNTTLSLVTILLSVASAFTLKKWFTRLGKFDAINYRSVHKTQATKTGGITIFVTLFLISIYLYITEQELFDFSLLIPIGIMFIVGVYDDFYNADFKLKFLLQIVVAKILIDQGFVIDHFHGVLGLQEIPRVASQIFTVFVFLIIVNAINFIDGIDGMAITETIKVILLVEFFSETFTPIYFLGVFTILSSMTLYYFNFKKENKVFLGDAGSLLFGTLIAIYLFQVLGSDYNFKESYQINKPLFTMSLLIYPLIDLLRIFLIRISNKKSPFSPDQNHVHHLLLKKGYSHFKIVLIIQFASLVSLATVIIIS